MPATDMANLLLIDDDDLVRFSLNELLTDAGHQVVEMSSGLGCEKYLETQLIDCVITDIVMPDKDGIEVLLSVKQTFPTFRS
jgi:CheY-like chemotaxis protein